MKAKLTRKGKKLLKRKGKVKAEVTLSTQRVGRR